MKNDVIIVGACSAGTYFASLLAARGLNVLVIDKDSEENLCKRLDIFHFTRDSFKDFNLEESNEGDPEFVHNFSIGHSRSALNNYETTSHTKVAVMHLPLFIKKLRGMAIKNGATFRFNTEFESLLYDENHKICGIKTTSGEELKARLVVDASGIPSVVRRQIKDEYMENFEITPRDKFYVLLKYVHLKDPKDKVEISTSWPFYKGWIAPQTDPYGAIVGVGANLSFDYARKCMKKLEDSVPIPAYDLEYEEMGTTPYRRPPFSFVTDGFLVLGDAACLTKPWCGEGVTAAWVESTPAADIVAEALKDDKYPTKEALWKINELYQKGQGAEFASTSAMLIGAMGMSEKDNDFLFKKRIVFKSDDEEGCTKMVSTLLKGVLKREFSMHALISLLKGVLRGNKLLKLYKNYPSDPTGYKAWVKKANKIYAKVGTMADNIKDA